MTPADRQAIDDNIRLTVDRTALRKVRKLVDEVHLEESARRRLERRALTAAVIVGALTTTCCVYAVLKSDDRFDFGQSVQVPARVAVPQKS